MDIYLVRHAEAIERKEGLAEELRHLTPKGRRQASNQAKRLKKKMRVELIITSPLVRAVQTAELLAIQVGKKAFVCTDACLACDTDAGAVLDMIRSLVGSLKSVMLVGHEPQLSYLAGLLLGYEQVSPLQKGSCLALSWHPEKHDSHAAFKWYAGSGKKTIRSARKALVLKA